MVEHQVLLSYSEPVQPPEPMFDGETYDEVWDGERLKTNLDKTFSLMRDGERRTLRQIAEAVGCSESGVSARIRDLRKAKWQLFYGQCDVKSERVSGGVWHYWLKIKKVD
jgi:hypothetical protein